MKKILFVLCCLSILCNSRLEAQHRISGSISSENKEALAGATFILMSQDSLFGGAVTDTKGRFELREVPAGDYTYEISMLGFQPVKQALKVNGNISLGTGVVGGMIVGTLALLFVVPSLFIVFQAMEERLMPKRKPENVDEGI